MEIGTGFDEANNGDEVFRIDQFFEGHVVQVELSGDGDHDAVQSFFRECSEGPDTQLAAEHDIEGMGASTAGFVAELQSVDFPSDTGLFFEFFGDFLCDHLAEVAVGNGQVSVVVARNAFEVLIGEVFCESFRQHNDSVVLSFLFASFAHHGDDAGHEVEPQAQADAAAAKALALIDAGQIELEPNTAWIDEKMCSGCKTCIPLCPFKAISPDEERKIAVVDLALCKGCGTCASWCPSAAITARHFTAQQVHAMIDAGL